MNSALAAEAGGIDLRGKLVIWVCNGVRDCMYIIAGYEIQLNIINLCSCHIDRVEILVSAISTERGPDFACGLGLSITCRWRRTI